MDRGQKGEVERGRAKCGRSQKGAGPKQKGAKRQMDGKRIKDGKDEEFFRILKTLKVE